MNTKKKKCHFFYAICAGICVCCIPSLFSQALPFVQNKITVPYIEPLDWTLDTSFGVFNGVAREYSYENTSVISELIWNFNSLVYNGVSFELFIPDLFFTLVEFKVVNPSDIPKGTVDGTAVFSVYSDKLPELYANQLIDLHVLWGKNFNPRYNIKVSSFIDFTYRQYDWIGQFPQASLSYAQEIFTPAVGCSFLYIFNKNLQGDIQFSFSPLVYCIAWNSFQSRDVVISEKMFPGIYINPQLTLKWSAMPWCTVKVLVSWFTIDDLRGAAVVRQDANPIELSYSSGMRLYVNEIGVRLAFSL